MAQDMDRSILERHGLTVAHVLRHAEAAARAEETAWAWDFSIQMRNDVRLSKCDDPSRAIATGRLEFIRVEVRSNLMTIATIWGERCASSGEIIERIGARRYALKSVTLEGATVYSFTNRLPQETVDDRFFPASGTAVLFHNVGHKRRVLKACGSDENAGFCQGWIFHAIEI